MFSISLFTLDSQLAVVPVLVNTGVAVLPAILAALASVAALIFKPKLLFRACKQNPRGALGIFAALALVCGLIYWMISAPPTAAAGTDRSRGAAAATGGTGAGSGDWAAVAREIIREQARAPLPEPSEVPTVSATSTAETAMDAPLIFRTSNQRPGTIGDSSPIGLQAAWEFEAEPFAHVLASPIRHGDVVYGASAMVEP
jgi:hypothetical protein